MDFPKIWEVAVKRANAMNALTDTEDPEARDAIGGHITALSDELHDLCNT